MRADIANEDRDRDLHVVARTRKRSGRASEPLGVAIKLGDLPLCKRIVQQGVDLKAGYRDCDGCTPLLYSLRLRKPAIAEYLALEGAAPTGQACHYFNPLGLSVFHLAAKHNYLELLRILLERHLNQYLHLTDPIHPFHLAICFQATQCVFLMISYIGKGRSSSKPHQLSTMRLITLTEGTPTSAASHRYAKGYAYHLANLRVGELDTSSKSYFIYAGDTPLVLAIRTGNHKIARLLLEAGSLVDEGDVTHRTPLHHAALLGNRELVELLLEFGANPQVQNRELQTPAMLAAKEGHVSALQALIKGGADLHTLDWYRWNTLYHAIIRGRTKVSLYLMITMGGYDLSQKTILGKSALEEAFEFSNHDTLHVLLNIAPSPGAYCPGRDNILTCAVGNSRMTAAVMKLLLKRVPQELLATLLTHRSRFGGTPLYAACTRTSMFLQNTMISLLLDVGANLETEGGDYGTPLMGACATGRLQAVKLLVRKGAKMVYCNEHGRYFSAPRAAKHFPEIVRWLLVGRHLEGLGLLTNGGIGRSFHDTF